MKHRLLIALVPLSLLIVSVVGTAVYSHPTAKEPVRAAQQGTAASQALAARGTNLPLVFEPNAGQAEKPVKFLAHIANGRVLFSPDQVEFELAGRNPAAPPLTTGKSQGTSAPRQTFQTLAPFGVPTTVRMGWLGSNAVAGVNSGAATGGSTGYFLGNDRSKWQSNLPTYRTVTYPDLYPDVSLAYSGSSEGLQGQYTIAAGGSPTQIRWRWQNAKHIQLSSTGNIEVVLPASADSVTTAGVTALILAPQAWQETQGKRTNIVARYVVDANQTVNIAVGTYNPNQALMLNTTVVYDPARVASILSQKTDPLNVTPWLGAGQPVAGQQWNGQMTRFSISPRLDTLPATTAVPSRPTTPPRSQVVGTVIPKIPHNPVSDPVIQRVPGPPNRLVLQQNVPGVNSTNP